MNHINKIKDKIKYNIKDLSVNTDKQKILANYILLPFVLNILIEILSRKSFIKGFIYLFTSPVPFICNTLIILITLMISLFFKKRKFLLTLISFIWLILGFTNFILLSNRVTPFNATDILLIKTALAVAPKYYNFFTLSLIIIGILLILSFIIYLWFKAPRLKDNINYSRSVSSTIVIILLTISSLSIAIDTKFISTKFDNIANAYLDYGFPYCFFNSVFNTGVSKPANYSHEKIKTIIDETEKSKEIKSNKKINSTPNVIFLQLESFFDINRYNNVKLSKNPIPNFTNLIKKYPSGFFNVPVVGAGTANTEFEVLTGMNIDDFGPGEYPYKTILQSITCESISTNFKANGYSTHAIHNNNGTFYQRNIVFSQLGFDRFIPIEYMNVTEYTEKNWARDKILTNEIMKCLKTTKSKDFIYTISVEGHGSYPANKVLEDPPIKVTDVENDAKIYAMEYYVNLLYSMDQFVGDLVNKLSEYDEEIILVLFGDHLPSLGIADSKLDSGTIYQTEYIIWNNMNLTIANENIEAYQISSKIFELLGIDTGVINKYHQTHKYNEEYLNGLQNIEYDILYGDLSVYDGVNPYNPSTLNMGIDKIKITELFTDSENENSLILKGTNFTKSSVVYVNDKEYDTEYIDTSTLRVKYSDLTYQDKFKVSQQGIDKVVLSSTGEFIYDK
ncbi:MAG: LTA synthase family protein [Clostridiales bacterium]